MRTGYGWMSSSTICGHSAPTSVWVSGAKEYFREAVYRDGEYHSLMLMSILDREYRECNASARGLE